jgi:hypothetical protein
VNEQSPAGVLSIAKEANVNEPVTPQAPDQANVNESLLHFSVANAPTKRNQSTTAA